MKYRNIELLIYRNMKYRSYNTGVDDLTDAGVEVSYLQIISHAARGFPRVFSVNTLWIDVLFSPFFLAKYFFFTSFFMLVSYA